MKKILIALFLILMANQLFAQDYKYGKVSKEELEEKYCPLDSSANAAVLYKKRKTFFDYKQDVGFEVVTEIHERIKIYNKEGFDWATKKIDYYNSTQAREKIIGLKATTYNLENSKIIETDLNKKEVFDQESNKYWSEQKFTMPNIKEGCVLEWTYKIISPFKRIEDLQFQYEIPVKKIEAQIEIPEYFIYNKRYKGYYPIEAKVENKNTVINLINKSRVGDGYGSPSSMPTVTQTRIDLITKIESYEVTNIPAIIEEAYVNNLDNYKTAIQYEYAELHWPNDPIKYYATSWENVVKTIYNDYDFSSEIYKSNHFMDDLNLVLAASSSDSQKISGILELAKSKIKWNHYNGLSKFNGTKKAYKEGIGNVADINLNLVSMLNKAGFKASPVILSTKSNGIPLFPTINGFNYVIAAVEIDNNLILLDATEEYSIPNVLPSRVLNWQGRILRENGSSESVVLTPSKLSETSSKMSISINDQGVIEGLKRTQFSELYALNYRNKYAKIKEDDVILKVEAENGAIEISDFRIANKSEIYKPITEMYKFSSEDLSEKIGDKIYFKPLFFDAMTENPFKLEKRDYPIDFDTPFLVDNKVSIQIPAGYEVESVPENIAIGLRENYGTYRFNIKIEKNVINIYAVLQINTAIFPSTNYEEIKEFYKIIVNKNLEQIVLKKV
ncbi:MAG: transglutaminase [Bacteroidetes bacterium HGW-Bacteroidetes-3]|jgi:hypothetical protein|nr:MAG: transglutaminase [Bacteroidetes bacterium HGW-Bacteroidetes-3]